MTRSDDGASEVAALLPLTPVAFEILLSLSTEERHGYAILRSVEERSEGRRSLHAGTLYRALARLMEAGLIGRLDERPDPDTDERRAYYRLTDLGRRVAAAEARRLDGLVGAARAGGLLGGTEPA
jgi:DNA-binding PadR family transcriptional regulator